MVVVVVAIPLTISESIMRLLPWNSRQNPSHLIATTCRSTARKGVG